MHDRANPQFRISLLLALTLLWASAGSVFTPWATDLAPRLRLYDTLFYLRFVLLFWGVAELLQVLMAWRDSRNARRAVRSLAMLALAATIALASYLLDRTAMGLQWKTRWSADALRAELGLADSDLRHRAGWLIVDTRRHPCGNAPWLWLGRPFGGGTSTSLALVHSDAGVPLSPDADAFRFRPVAHGWWLAYQDAVAYRRGLEQHAGVAVQCVPGTTLAHHRAGLEFVAHGQQVPGSAD